MSWEFPERVRERPRLAPRCPRCKADLGRHPTTHCVVCRRVLHVDCDFEAGCPCQGSRQRARAPARPTRDVAAALVGVGLTLLAAAGGRWRAVSSEPARVVSAAQGARR